VTVSEVAAVVVAGTVVEAPLDTAPARGLAQVSADRWVGIDCGIENDSAATRWDLTSADPGPAMAAGLAAWVLRLAQELAGA
jgi:hypothetical protein